MYVYLVLAQDVTWGNFDDAGNIVGLVCYGCVELCGKLRPAMSAGQCLAAFRADDEKLQQDFEEGLKAEGDEEIEGQFQPSSSVGHDQSYSFVVYQDIALLSEAEFTRLCKLTPAQAGYGTSKSKKQCLTLSFMGRPNQKYYPVGLQGMPLDELMACRKMRVQFVDSAPWILRLRLFKLAYSSEGREYKLN